MNICVYCASSDTVSPLFKAETRKLGTWIGENGHTLIFGGATGGLMDEISESVKESNGFIIGIVPEKIIENGRKNDNCDQLFRTDTMSERKEMMKEYADICIGLPGGFGTLDEIFDTVASSMLGYNELISILINIDGYYDHLIEQFKRMYTEKIGYPPQKKLLQICNSIEECIAFLEKMK